MWKNQSRDPDRLVPAGLADECGGSHGWHFQKSFYRRNRPHFLASFGLFCPFLPGTLMCCLEAQQTSCSCEATKAEDESPCTLAERKGGKRRRAQDALLHETYCISLLWFTSLFSCLLPYASKRSPDTALVFIFPSSKQMIKIFHVLINITG